MATQTIDSDRGSWTLDTRPERILGNGAYGIVYRAKDSRGRDIAAKMIDGKKHPKILDQNFDKLMELKHDNVVRMFDVIRQPGTVLLFMDICIFGDLNTFFKDQQLKLEGQLEIMIQIARGISYLHEKDVIHRDIKPDNILIAQRSPILVKLTDFDVSKFFHPDVETSAMATNVGTQAFKAPEFFQRNDKKELSYHRNVDVYAAGLTFLGMIQYKKGRAMIVPRIETPQFNSELHQAIGTLIAERIKYKVPDLNIVVVKQGITDPLDDVRMIIAKMTSVEPERRLSARDVVAELQKIKEPESSSAEKGTSSKEKLPSTSAKIGTFTKEEVSTPSAKKNTFSKEELPSTSAKIGTFAKEELPTPSAKKSTFSKEELPPANELSYVKTMVARMTSVEPEHRLSAGDVMTELQKIKEPESSSAEKVTSSKEELPSASAKIGTFAKEELPTPSAKKSTFSKEELPPANELSYVKTMVARMTSVEPERRLSAGDVMTELQKIKEPESSSAEKVTSSKEKPPSTSAKRGSTSSKEELQSAAIVTSPPSDVKTLARMESWDVPERFPSPQIIRPMAESMSRSPQRIQFDKSSKHTLGKPGFRCVSHGGTKVLIQGYPGQELLLFDTLSGEKLLIPAACDHKNHVCGMSQHVVNACAQCSQIRIYNQTSGAMRQLLMPYHPIGMCPGPDDTLFIIDVSSKLRRLRWNKTTQELDTVYTLQTNIQHIKRMAYAEEANALVFTMQSREDYIRVVHVSQDGCGDQPGMAQILWEAVKIDGVETSLVCAGPGRRVFVVDKSNRVLVLDALNGDVLQKIKFDNFMSDICWIPSTPCLGFLCQGSTEATLFCYPVKNV